MVDLKDKKVKNHLLYSKNPNDFFLEEGFSIRKIFCHISTFVYVSILTTLLFVSDVNIKSPKEWIKLLWLFTIFITLTLIYRKSSHVILSVFRSMFIIMTIFAVYLGYSFFLLFYTSKIEIKNISELSQINIYLIPLFSSSIFWYIVLGFVERKTRPIKSELWFYKALNSALMLTIYLISFYQFKEIYVLKNEKFNLIENRKLYSMVILCSVLFFITIILQVYMIKNYKVFFIDSREMKSTSFGVALIQILSFSIWYFVSNVYWYNSWQSIVYLIINILIILALLFVTFKRKSSINQSKIYFVICSFALLIIWSLQYIASEVYVYQIPLGVSKSIPLVSTTIISILLYFKGNSSNNNLVIKVYEKSNTLIWMVLLLNAISSQLGVTLDQLPISISELTNLVLVLPFVLIFSIQSIWWYFNQSKISRTSKKIINKNKKPSKNNKINKINTVRERG